MNRALLIPMIAAVSVLAGVSGPAAQTAKKPEATATKPTPEAMATKHTVDGKVTKVNAKKGWIDVKTSEGSMKLHFPSAALNTVKAGDSVTVELGMTRLASSAENTSKTK